MGPSRGYYVPGLISLVGLVPLCVIGLFSTGRLERLSVLTVTFSDTSAATADPFPWSGPPQRTWSEFRSSDLKDRSALAEFKAATRALHAHPSDTVHGIHLHFTQGTDYRSFIHALDVARIDSGHYRLDGQALWMFHLPPATMAPQPPAYTCDVFPVCGTRYTTPRAPIADMLARLFRSQDRVPFRDPMFMTVLLLLIAVSIRWAWAKSVGGSCRARAAGPTGVKAVPLNGKAPVTRGLRVPCR